MGQGIAIRIRKFLFIGWEIKFWQGKVYWEKTFPVSCLFVFFWRGEGGGEGISTLLANCGETYPISHSPIRENPSVSQKHSGLHLDQKLNFNKQ